MEKLWISLALIVVALSNCSQPEKNYFPDGGFELQETGPMQEPFHIKPGTKPDKYVIILDETAFEGSQLVRIQADTAAWFEVSQYVQLETATKYSASLYMRGEECEVHAGAYCYGSQKFLGWNNDEVPGVEWTKVSFDFISDSTHSETKIYVDFRHMKEPVTVDVDAIKVVVSALE